MLEHTFGGILLAALLQQSPVRGLGEDVTPIEVRFQQGATHPVDDLMVIGKCSTGKRALYIGVRRNPTISARNSAFVTLMVDFLRMVVSHRAQIDRDQCRLGLAAAGPHTACQEVGQLAQFARTQRDNRAFRSAVAAPRATNGKVRGRLRTFDEVVSKAAVQGGIPLKTEDARDKLTWQLLRALHIIDLRLEGDDPADRITVIAGLVPLAGDALRAADLWHHLVHLSSQYAQTAATVDKTLLHRELSSRIQIGSIEPPSPNVLGDRNLHERPTEPSRTVTNGPRSLRQDKGTTSTNNIATPRQSWQLIAVADCLPEQVGVHNAGTGQSDSGKNLDLPVYVMRDHDEPLRARLRQAATEGGLVVVVGGSSTGKSRSLYEAVREVCSDWQLLLADDAGAVRKATSQGISGRTVIWLDDTPSLRYLAAGGLTRADLLALTLRKPDEGPVVVVNMLWSTAYQQVIGVPQAGADPGAQINDTWRDAREVVSLAAQSVVEVPEQFSQAERERVAQVADATGDRRLIDALADTQYGVTQHLAGAPQLINHWKHASSTQPYGWAVLTAAIDIRRLGIRVPLTVDLLTAIAPTYLTDTQTAEAPSSWFDKALSYAIRKLHGQVQSLRPVPGPMIGTVHGYEVADFLQQYGSTHRYYKALPIRLWDILPSHVHSPDALTNLALNAEVRGLSTHAITLYRRAYASSRTAQWRLANLLAACNREDELRELVVLGDAVHARRLLAKLLAAQGREDELRKLANSRDADARWQLALLLLDGGRKDKIEELVSSGGVGACDLTGLLSRPRALMRESRERAAADAFVAEMLARRGQKELRPAPAGDCNDNDSRKQLAAHEGELRKLASDGSVPARRVLAELLAEQAREDDLREMAAAGDLAARRELAGLLAKQGREDELRQMADSGDTAARYLLVEIRAARACRDRS